MDDTASFEKLKGIMIIEQKHLDLQWIQIFGNVQGKQKLMHKQNNR